MIKLKNLNIGYNSDLLTIEEINLEQGQVYILLGKNGSGKSTFLKTLSAQIPVRSGECQLDGKEISQITHRDLPKLVSFVSSRLEDTDFLTAFDYIGLGRSPYTNGFGRLHPLDLVKIYNAIDLLGIDHLKDRFIGQLSDGERQLVAIAKSIAQETDILLLDEPTAFLDYTNKMMIIERLKTIAQELNKCIILSSHDLDLSIDSDCPFLVVNQHTNTIDLLSAETQKDQLIQKAY